MTPSEQTLATILALKKTASPINGAPMGYREIGMRLGLSAMGVRWHASKVVKGRCPQCLQKLETEKTKPM